MRQGISSESTSPQKRPTSGHGDQPQPKYLEKTNSRSSNKRRAKRRFRTCCGGAHIPVEERDAILQEGTNNSSGIDTCMSELSDGCITEDGILHADYPRDVSSPRQESGLFQMLLDGDGQFTRVGLDTDGESQGGVRDVVDGGQFSGVESTYKDAADEEVQQSPISSPDKNKSPRTPGRRPKRRKICEDPFAKLPPIFQNPPMTITEDNKEQRKTFHQRVVRKGASGKFGKPLYPDDPFKQLAHIIFSSADVDKDKKLNRREFASILNAPSLELDLLKDDIKMMEKECCQDRDDIKRNPVSFEEFLPLAECLLPLYYSKKDTESKNAWCILDRDKMGHLYFNKHTAEISLDRPVDYNEENELYLFEEALSEVFETADMDKDGKIKLQDFFRIINSADFGLLLTKRDVKELTKQFLNEAGKVSKVTFSEFIPLAKRLIVTVYRARDSTPYEWCHLYTRHVGSFWFNKRTGQTQRYAPNFYVRMQQTALLYRENEMKVFAQTAEELIVTKATLEQEMAQREDFEQKYTDLTSEHDKLTGTHEETVAILERTKAENEKKQRRNEMLEKETTKLQSKVKYLEQRVSEMEKTEANLESLREVLRSCQTTVREREHEIEELNETLSTTSKKLNIEQEKSEHMGYKIEDLHQQLRDEIKQNKRMEKELDRIPNLQKELDLTNARLQQMETSMEEKKAHVILARATHREDKERIQFMEKELSRLPGTEKELEMAKCEVYTLKQLLAGKDRLVMKKSQELESVKEKLEEDPGGGRPGQARGSVARASYVNTASGVKVMKMDSSPSSMRRHSSRQDFWASVNASSSSSSSGPPSIVSNGGRRASNKGSNRRSSRLDVSTPPNGVIPESRPASAPLDESRFSETPPTISSGNTKNGRILKLLYNNGTLEDMPMVYDDYTPDGSYSPVGKKPSTPSLKNGLLHSSDRPEELESSTHARAGTLMFEDDFMAAQFIHVGDRVRLRKPGAKSGSCKTSDILTGIVKFVGKIDKEKTDHRIYVGLKLDDAVGDTDGVIKDKRYFNVNQRHGKLVRINHIISVLNPKTASYKRVSEFIREQRLETGTLRFDKDGGPQLIRVV